MDFLSLLSGVGCFFLHSWRNTLDSQRFTEWFCILLSAKTTWFAFFVFELCVLYPVYPCHTSGHTKHTQNWKKKGWGRYNLPRKMVTENGCLSKLGQATKTFRRKSKVYLSAALLLVGGFNPSEKYYSSQIGSFPQIRMKIKHVWNHDLVFLEGKRPKHTHGSLEDSTIIGGYLKFRICRNTSLDPTGSMVTGIFTY